METTTRRERKRAAVRERILEAARELFAAHGFEAVTMQQIAARVDYSAAALYAYFPDKAALFRELCAADFLALRQAFERIAAVADPIERLRRMGRAYVEFGRTHPNHYRLMFLAPHAVNPEDQQLEKDNPDEDAYAFLRANVAQAIAAGRLRPECADAEQVAQMLWSSVHGLVALHMTFADDPWVSWRPLPETAALLVDALIRGVTTEGGG